MATTLLDYAQCIKGSYIEESNMLRTGATVAIEVSVLAGASTGAITDSATDCDGVSKLNLHCKVGSGTLSTAAVAVVQYSPSDEDDIWIDSALSLTSSTTAEAITTGTLLTTLLARRIRLKLNTAPVGGDVSFYVLGS